MARKKAKGRRRKNPLQLKIRPVSIPRGIATQEFLEVLHGAVRGGDLPDDWEVEISWRNPATKKGRSAHWQTNDFAQAISESSSGFATAVEHAIESKMEPGPARPKRKPTKKVPKKKAAPAKSKQTKFERDVARSKAARKGWATRRAKAAA